MAFCMMIISGWVLFWCWVSGWNLRQRLFSYDHQGKEEVCLSFWEGLTLDSCSQQSIWLFLFMCILTRENLAVEKKKNHFLICWFLLTSTTTFQFLLSVLAFNRIYLSFIVRNRKTREENIRRTKQNWFALPRARSGDLDLSTVPEMSFLCL